MLEGIKISFLCSNDTECRVIEALHVQLVCIIKADDESSSLQW